MLPTDLSQEVHRRPFVPFRIHMTDGTIYEVRHPELVMIGQLSAVIGYPSKPGLPFYERADRVSLLHVQRIEPLEQEAQVPRDGNGEEG